MEFPVPRPKKVESDQDDQSLDKKPELKYLHYAMGKSRSYQKSQKRFVEKLIPIQPITIEVKEIDGKRFEWVPCEKISVEI